MRRSWAILALAIAAVGLGQTARAQTQIKFQGFESGDSWTISAGSGNISSTTGSGDTPSNQRIATGTNSWQVNNSTETLDLSSVSITGYTNVFVNYRVSSTSTNPTNGSDVGDYARSFIALNGGAFAANGASTADISLTGNSNSTWGFNATLSVSTTAGTNVQQQAPGSGTSNYDDFTIDIPNGNSSLAFRAIALNNDNKEVWCVDNIDLRGTVPTTVAWDADGTGGGTGGTGTWDTTNRRFTNGNLIWNNTVNGSPTAVTFGNSAGVVTLASGGISSNSLTFSVDGYTVQSNTLNIVGTTATMSVTTSGHAATISSQVSGSANLQKSGAGRLILSSASNSYTGTTFVSAGELVVNGTHTGGDNYSVASGARLGGSGSINLASGKSVSVSGGGTVAPGTSAGKLTVGGSFTLSASTAILEIEVNGTNASASNYDQLEIRGSGSALTLGGARLNILAPTASITLTSSTTLDAPNAYKIINVTSSATYAQASNLFGNLNGQTASALYDDGGMKYRVFYVNNDGVYVQFNSIPEPSTLSLVALSAGSLLARRRHRAA